MPGAPRTAIVQFDNRPARELGPMPWLVRRNAAYAERHGYEHHFFDQAYFDLPVYWQKPSLVGRVLQLGFERVLWLDTDAVVHDLDRPLDSLVEGGESLVGAPDNPFWTSPFNAGVFLATGPGAADVMQAWAGLFAGTAWRRTDTAWICEEEWAGPSFEQGAFNAHLLEPLAASGQLRLADWRLLQSPFPHAGAFTLHFAGPFKANIPAYLQLIGA